MIRFAKFFCVSVASVLLASQSANGAVELMDLVNNNGSIVAGNIVFDQFSLVTDGNITSETEVNVETIMDASGNFGIRFQGGLDDLAGDGPSLWRVSYRATSQDGSAVFTGATLSGNPAAIVSGRGAVTLSADQIPSNEYLNIFDDINLGTSLLDSGTFADPATSLDVSVEFLADAGDTRGAVTASFIDQTFTQDGVVPEATSIVTWTIMLFGAAIVVAWKRVKTDQEAELELAKTR